MSSDGSCPYCGIAQKDQHSLREGGICDGLRSGKIRKVPTQDKSLKTEVVELDDDEVIDGPDPSPHLRSVVEVQASETAQGDGDTGE